MKKSLKSFVALMLALIIAISFKPISAEAAVKGLRTNAAKGKKYTITINYPGNVKVKANVKFTEVTTNNYTYLGYSDTTVRATLTFPKKELKKVQRNVHKIVTSAPYVRTVGYEKQYKGSLEFAATIIDAETGKNINNRSDAKCIGLSCLGEGYKIYRQDNARMGFYPKYNIRYTVRYYPTAKGKILVGVAGQNKPIYDNNKGYKKFVNGKVSITKTSLYNKKGKNSIFMKF